MNMDDSTSREKVLKKIRNANIYKTDNPYTDIDFNAAIYKEMNESLDVTFAQELTRIAGKFIYCENDLEFAQTLKALAEENDLGAIHCQEPELISVMQKSGIPVTTSDADFLKMKAGLTGCEYLIARLGSVMVSSKQASGRRMFVYPEVHIVHAYLSQLVPDLQDAIGELKQRYGNNMPSLISVISGPSRTADIEKTLVMGAHGPKELYVFLVDDPR
jgi:L-lactate dehydrogenase complex protein LldG